MQMSQLIWTCVLEGYGALHRGFSRLDEKTSSAWLRPTPRALALRERAALVLCVRGLDDPDKDIANLGGAEQIVLREILDVIDGAEMRERVYFLNMGSQLELAATYRYFARRGSVFALTSYYEPFGLAPIEAAATGLAPVVTKNGGPMEIFADGSGVLVDPFSAEEIADGLLDGLSRHAELSKAARKRCRKLTHGVRPRRATLRPLILAALTSITRPSRSPGNLMKPSGSRFSKVPRIE